jgi:hypothetical protein
MSEYISELDFGIENPTKIICMVDTPTEKITNAYVEKLNNEIYDFLKKTSKEIYT